MRLIFAAGVAVALMSAAFAQTDWPTFGHDPAGTRYSTLKQIDTKNVTKLVRAWTYHMNAGAPPPPAAAPVAGSSEAGDAAEGRGRGRGGGGGGGGNSEVSPVVIDGVMYLTTGARRAAWISGQATSSPLPRSSSARRAES
jgi:quinoprotein glucose dehydrogenase